MKILTHPGRSPSKKKLRNSPLDLVSMFEDVSHPGGPIHQFKISELSLKLYIVAQKHVLA